jgi:hypothetical protein
VHRSCSASPSQFKTLQISWSRSSYQTILFVDIFLSVGLCWLCFLFKSINLIENREFLNLLLLLRETMTDNDIICRKKLRNLIIDAWIFYYTELKAELGVSSFIYKFNTTLTKVSRALSAWSALQVISGAARHYIHTLPWQLTGWAVRGRVIKLSYAKPYWHFDASGVRIVASGSQKLCSMSSARWDWA